MAVQTLGEDLEDASNELMLADEEEVNDFAHVCSLEFDVPRLQCTMLTMLAMHQSTHTRYCIGYSASMRTDDVLRDSVQVRFAVGDCFYHAAPDEAEEKLQEGEKNTSACAHRHMLICAPALAWQHHAHCTERYAVDITFSAYLTA